MKSINRRIFISIIMHSNVVHFCQNISFKSALKNFTPVSGHLRTVLMVCEPLSTDAKVKYKSKVSINSKFYFQQSTEDKCINFWNFLLKRKSIRADSGIFLGIQISLWRLIKIISLKASKSSHGDQVKPIHNAQLKVFTGINKNHYIIHI